MYIQIATYSLGDMSDKEYCAIAEMIVPVFSNVPGLVSNTWLTDPETGAHGGVYVWRSREAMEAHRHTDIFSGIVSNPRLEDVTVREFGVLEAPTRITGGAAQRILVRPARGSAGFQRHVGTRREFDREIPGTVVDPG